MLPQASKLKRLRLLTIVLVSLVLLAYELLEHFAVPPATPEDLLLELGLLLSLLSVTLYLLFGALIKVFARLEQSHRQLASLRNYQASLLESSPYAILSVDKEDLIRSFNEQAGVITGHSSQEAIGTDVTKLFTDTAKVRRALHAARLHGGVESIDETPLTTRRGAEIPISITLRRIHDEDGGGEDCVLIIEDLQEKKRLERRLIVSERLAAATQLAAGIAHGIRNPLASIGINLKNLHDHAQRGGPGKERERLFSVISSEVQRLSRLVDGFIRHAVPHRTESSASLCRINEILSAALDQCQPLLEEKGIDLVASLPESALCIKADRQQLAHAFANIIQNAAEAVPLSGHLEIKVRQQGHTGLIEVRDDGCGMQAEDLERILDFCFTTKPSGLGVGLSFASLTIEQHGGRIEIESEPGKGTRVFVWLPLRNGEV